MRSAKMLTLTADEVYSYSTVYEATLPTFNNAYAFMEETLECLIQFISIAEVSLVAPKESEHEPIIPVVNRF